MNGKPAKVPAGAENVAVGATLETFTVASSTVVADPSLTCTRTVGLAGPSPAV